MWPDHWGHSRGKRIPAETFLEHADGDGIAFCDAVLSYGVTGEAQDGTLLTGWETGYPDLQAIPDLQSFRMLPWRVGLVRSRDANLGGDNRTVAVCALLESPASARLELRTPGADAQPHWAIAGVLAAILAGIDAAEDPGEPVTGDGYGQGVPLPATLADGIAAARSDLAAVEVLGADAVHDLTTLAAAEWRAFTGTVSQWDRDRYLRTI